MALVVLAAVVPAAWCDGDAWLRGEHWKRLRACAEQRLKNDPADAEAQYWLARVKIEAGDFDGAQPLAEKAAAARPKRADVRFWMAVVFGRQAQSAGFLRRFGLARRFKKEAEAALALDPAYIDARLGLVDFHLQAPPLVGGDPTRAEALAAEIARLDPSRGWSARARMARQRKEAEGLEELLRKAVEADPRRYDALVELATFQLDAKRDDAAEGAAARALKLDPGRAPAYQVLAALYARQKRWSDLDAVLVALEREVPDNLHACFLAGVVLLAHTEQEARAEGLLRRYLTQEPEIGATPHAVAHLRLAQLMARTGRTLEAMAALEAALALDPKLEDAKTELGRLKAPRP